MTSVLPVLVLCNRKVIANSAVMIRVFIDSSWTSVLMTSHASSL